MTYFNIHPYKLTDLVLSREYKINVFYTTSKLT